MEAGGERRGATSTAAPGARNRTELSADERERVRMQFYATYDVMTGVRIAATLGGFFALMVALVVYKSRSKSVKALRDPKIVELAEAAVAVEEAVEEERQLSAALECALAERRASTERRSHRESRASLPSLGAPRYSVAGYLPQRRRSSVAWRSRRLSSLTCSSSGSSYLERRGSSVVCALPERRLSPCPSERDSAERLAPLASLVSAGSWGECELGSLGADSVFAPEQDASTDDEVEQFSTDSGGAAPDCTEMSTRSPAPPPLDPERATRCRETLF